ncbi:MAG: FMN-binding protein [Pseudomonadota bacterium]|nr:FMN-binding protein [Pseudomonadota bacterium]
MNNYSPNQKNVPVQRITTCLRIGGLDLMRRHAQSMFVATAVGLLLLSFGMGSAQAVDSCTPPVCITFQTPEAFIGEAFAGSRPVAGVLNLDGAAASRVQAVYGRAFPQSRVRYWTNGARTAWVFDDLGKEGYQPTTAAFAVENGAIVAARVIYYRESRGEQVGEGYFLQQLTGAHASGGGLDQSVDNIAGATYSVEMMKRMARTAIEFDALTR